MSTKIKFSDIFIDPINNISNHIENNIDSIVEEFFKQEFEETRPNYKQIDECDYKINENKKEIILYKKNNKIRSISFLNGIIFTLFFILIGFAFWVPYKRNKEKINKFNKFKNDKYDEINNLITIKNTAIFSSFSTLTLRDVYYYAFEKLGIKVISNIESQKIINLINEKEIIDVYSGIYGIIQNSPFYDVIVRKLSMDDVPWSKSESFPYIDYETVYHSDGSTSTQAVTRYETLTATHYELTPFVNKKNLLIYKTNFLKELTISNNNSNYNKNILLENKDFINAVKIIDHSNEPQKLSQLFTIKTQEDFLKWYEKEKYKVFNFVKINDNFVVKNQSFCLPSLEDINKTLDSLFVLNDKSENLKIDIIKNKIKSKVIDYFSKFSKMVQLPLLIPGISREWYRQSGNYLIAQNSDLEIERIDSIEKIEILDVVNKFLDPKYFWFNCKHIPKKPIWITLDSVKTINECKVGFAKINSYYEQHLIEDIVVHGFHVGTQIISVPYIRYVKFDEEKIVLHYSKYKNTKTQFIVNNEIKKLIFNNHYLNDELFNKVKDLSLWTNDPSQFENSKNKENMLDLAKKFNEFNSKYNLEATLRIDEYGLYISINNISNVDLNILNELTKMLKNYSNINYWNE